MLQDFIAGNRDLIIARAKARVASRTSPKPSEAELANGIPVFVDQLTASLRRVAEGDGSANSELSSAAGRHGADLFRIGLTIAQVVRDYGDVCQAITEIAVEQAAPIAATEFQTLNLCLDDAIAEAVTEYANRSEIARADQGTEKLGILAHELRNLVSTAMLSFETIKTGRVAAGGSTGMVLGRSLIGLRDLIDRSLAEVRLDAGITHMGPIAVADLVAEVEIAASLTAVARAITLLVSSVDHTVTIHGDRQVLAAAIANLLQNAFKFTPKQGNVWFRAHATAERVLFEVEDECGGLPPGAETNMFRPFDQQHGHDRTGLGLGLSICQKAASANGGEIHVRDVPGKGCVFTLDLPRKPPPPLSVIEGGKSRPPPPQTAEGSDTSGRTKAQA